MKDQLRRLGQRIRDLRTLKGWSQEEFAAVCGVHRTYMGHLERGEKNVSFGSLLRLANALDIPMGHLFTGLESDGNLPENGKPVGRMGIDRDRLLAELASLERGLQRLKNLATSVEEADAERVARKENAK